MNTSFEKELVTGLQLWLQRWRRTLVFGFWLIALAFILPNGRYTLYLRPEFGIILCMALVVLAGFAVSDKINRLHAGHGTGGILSSLILLVPLLFLLRAGDSTLDAYAFQKRSTGEPAFAVAPSTMSSPAAAQNPDNPPDAREEDDLAPQILTILELYANPERYLKKPVEFIGMAHHNEEMKHRFGNGTIVVFRFAINCCAADALPLAVVVSTPWGSSVAEDAWCRVRGMFSIDTGGKPIPRVENAVITKEPKPKQPYLF